MMEPRESCVKLGIIGGMGARAGLRLGELLVRFAQQNGAVRDDQIPEFVYYNLSAQGMDETGIVSPLVLLKQLQAVIQQFNKLGVNLALIGCNTAHMFHAELDEAFNGVLLNMIDLACDAVMRCDEVGILCSRTSKQLLLYETALNHRRVRPVVTTDKEQQFLDNAISDAISGNRPDKHWKGIHCLIDTLHGRGAQKILGGCTEIPICLNGHAPPKDSFIDAGEVAVKHALRLLTSGAPETA